MMDARPANCRFRLQDEGKPYPRSGCQACGATVTTGLGNKCTRAQPAPADVVERVAKALARADCISAEDDWALFINKAKAAIEAMGVSDEVVERLKEVTALLMRYRMETPMGHSPHMICHQADAAIERANATIQALAHKEGNEV